MRPRRSCSSPVTSPRLCLFPRISPRSGKEALILGLISIVGSTLGALYLVWLSDDTFKSMVPWLLLAATVVFAAGSVDQAEEYRRAPAPVPLGIITQTFTSFYGGFFWRRHGHHDAGLARHRHRRRLPPPQCAEELPRHRHRRAVAIVVLLDRRRGCLVSRRRHGARLCAGRLRRRQSGQAGAAERTALDRHRGGSWGYRSTIS